MSNSAVIILSGGMDSTTLAYWLANLRATLEACQEFGYRLSLQTHKILGLP